MRRCLHLRGFVLACSLLGAGCTEILLEGTNYHPGAGPIDDPGACEDGLTTCDGECVRVESDSRNCGACGHDCFDAACSAGMCATQEVVPGVQEPRALAVDETHVYWTTAGGEVRRAPKEGGPADVIASGQGDSRALAVEHTHVFWIRPSDGTVVRAKKDGGGSGKPQQIFEGDAGDVLRGLALDDMRVYFNRMPALGQSTGDVRQASKAGGMTDKAEVFVEQPYPSEITLLGEYVAWSGYKDQADSRGPAGGYVRYAPRHGSKKDPDVFTLADGEGDIVALTAMGENAVWAEDGSGRIRTRGPADGQPVTLVENQRVVAITADAARVFWSTVNGNVKSHEPATHETRVLAFDIDSIGAVVADATHVYILRMGPNGAILRVAK